MLGIERRQQIMEKLNNEQKVYVAELAKLFNVTEETIRRDLEKLESKDLLRRSYGGAVLSEHTREDISFLKRNAIMSENKQIIAIKAAALVHDGDSLMVDASTTCLALLARLQQKKNLTIITHSARILHDYFASPHRLISTGGTLRANSCALVGHIAQETIQRYNVDLAFISCKGLSKERGIMESNEDESVLKEYMAVQANRTILLVDHTKFNQTAFVHSFDFDRIQTIVTDEPVSSGWRTLLEKKHIDLLD